MRTVLQQLVALGEPARRDVQQGEVQAPAELFDPAQQPPLLAGFEELDRGQAAAGPVVHDRDGRGALAALDLVEPLLEPSQRPQHQQRRGARTPAARVAQITVAVKQAMKRLSVTEALARSEEHTSELQ